MAKTTSAYAAALMLFAGAAFAAAPPAKRTVSPDGAFSLVPPARFVMKPERDGGMSSRMGLSHKYSMTFSYDIRTEAAHPGSCHGTTFPVSSRTALAYLKSWDACEALSHRGGPVIRRTGETVEMSVAEGVRLAYRVSRVLPAADLRRQRLDPKNYGSPDNRSVIGYLQVGDGIYLASAQLENEKGLREWLAAMRTVRAESSPRAPSPEPSAGPLKLLR